MLAAATASSTLNQSSLNRESRLPSATFQPSAIDACAWWRFYVPHLNLTNSRFVFRYGRILLQEFAESEVMFVQRQATTSNMEAIAILKENGFKVVYDMDDNLWQIPSYNPAKRIFEAMAQKLDECVKLCDAITVSTAQLKTAIKTALPNLNKEIFVCPNAIDFRLFREPIVPRDDGRIVIGWTGSNTHAHDTPEAWAAIDEILDENPNVYFEVTGYQRGYAGSYRWSGGNMTVDGLPKRLYSHPRVKIRPWVHISQFAPRLRTWAWDISLAPLEDNRFNLSKSGIKMYEAAATGTVCLASHVQPYHEFTAFDDDLSWLLCRSQRDWKTKLTELVNDKDKRLAYADKMRQVAWRHYNIENIKNIWEHVVKTVCSY